MLYINTPFIVMPLSLDWLGWLYIIVVFGPLAIAIIYGMVQLVVKVIWPVLTIVFDFKGRRKNRLQSKLMHLTKDKYEKALSYYRREKYGLSEYYFINDLAIPQLKELLNIPESEWIEAEKLEDQREKRIEDQYEEIKKKYPNGLELYLNRQERGLSHQEIVDTPIDKFSILEWSYEGYIQDKGFREDLNRKLSGYYKQIGNYLETSYILHEGNGLNMYGEECPYTFSYPHGYVYGYSNDKRLDYSYLPEFKDALGAISEIVDCKTHIDDIKEQRLIDLLKELHFPYAYISHSETDSFNQEWDNYHFGRIKETLVSVGTELIAKEDFLKYSFEGEPIVILELVSTINGINELFDSIIRDYNLYNLELVYISFFKEFSNQEVEIIIDDRKIEERYRKQEEEAAKQIIKAQLEKEFQQGLSDRIEEEFKRRQVNLHIIDENERTRLNNLSQIKKPDAVTIQEYLQENKINYFYHFTDKSNIDSIKNYGGLLSWHYCEEHGIIIPKPGGDELSHHLDSINGLSDYVRCSFCRNLPMKYTLSERKYDLVLLRIDASVACFSGTLFSNMNATDDLHHHGDSLIDLKKVNLEAVYSTYVSRDNDFFKLHQAEVMVQTFIPIRYISFPDALGRYK